MDDVLVTRKTKRIVLDGKETWTAGGEDDASPYVLTLADKKIGTTNFACSHSIPAASGTTPGTCVGSDEDGTITFYPPAGEVYDTLTKWKAALAAQVAGDPEAEPPIVPTPVQLVYELNEAVSEVDSGAWEGFSLWDDTTKITHDGGGALSVNYLLDMNAVVDDFETRLASAETT